MIRGKLIAKSGAVIVDPCLRTTNVFDRMRGLLLRPVPANGSGLLIDPGNVVELVTAIRRLHLDPTLRRSLGHNARARIQAEFGLENMIRAYESLYDALLR